MNLKCWCVIWGRFFWESVFRIGKYILAPGGHANAAAGNFWFNFVLQLLFVRLFCWSTFFFFFFNLRNKFIRIGDERAASGLRAVEFETTTTDGMFWPSNLANEPAPGRTLTKLFAYQGWIQGCSWLISGCRKKKYSNGTQTGKTTAYQRQLCLHLYRDLSPPWHPGWSCATWQVGHVLIQDSAGKGEVDSVFTWLMLGTHTQSELRDSVVKL